jgi:lysophospholipid acyltransferase (LPLAT)-like uncharacterized protein
MKEKLIAFVAWLFYTVLRQTWRLTVVEPPSLRENLNKRMPFILSHWHGDQMALAFIVKPYRIVTIVSKSRDGEIMNTFLRLNGGQTVRGSSSKGAAEALRSLVTQVKKWKLNVSFAVDGPKGPIYEVKPGVFQFQRLLKLNSPIFAAGVACDRFWRFEKAWDKTILPKPFAKVVIHWLDSGLVVSQDQDPRDPAFAKALKDAMQQSASEAQKILSSL